MNPVHETWTTWLVSSVTWLTVTALRRANWWCVLGSQSRGPRTVRPPGGVLAVVAPPLPVTGWVVDTCGRATAGAEWAGTGLACSPVASSGSASPADSRTAPPLVLACAAARRTRRRWRRDSSPGLPPPSSRAIVKRISTISISAKPAPKARAT